MELIFEENFAFGLDDYKSHKPVPFELRKDFGKLHVYFQYSPKEVNDCRHIISSTLRRYLPEKEAAGIGWEKYSPVTNLLTVALSCGGQYIGCAHRSPPKQHIIIAANGSAPGFIAFAPKRGMWDAIISLHAISTPVVCNLRIIGEG